ncbi:MAG: type III pantothenate kinase [Thermoleophilia bacterium]|nr:type III pantothenate kinase [Thermoleophilia bacterium]
MAHEHLLAIDVGNTQTLAGVYHGERLLHEWRISTEPTATADELAAAHDQIMRLRGGSLDELDALIVASVVPTLTAGYRGLADKYLGGPALVVGPGIKTGMPLLIDNPRELGADRLVNAVAAYHHHGGPCIVVDFGTATNVDVVSAAGEYLGGVIAPGVHTSLEALASRAARLITVDLVPPERLIGRSTVEAMRSGLVLGTVAMVDGLVVRARAEVGEDATVIATGGLAGLVQPLSEEIDLYEPLLTLEGLRLVHDLNRRPGGGR